MSGCWQAIRSAGKNCACESRRARSSEHLELLNELVAEYRLNLPREIAFDPNRPMSGRPRMVAFADQIPSLRIAVELKTELFRNAAKTWTVNMLHDIDAVSMAVPYCHVAVPDSEIADLLSRSGAGQRNGTQILAKLHPLPGVLEGLADKARSVGGDATGWEWAGPGEGFCLDESELRNTAPSHPPTA